MAYSKQTWVTGETITASKLNHMEDGIDAISANGAIDTANLANAAVTNDKLDQEAVDSNNIRTGCIITANLADGAVTLAKLADAVKSHFALADDVDDLKSAFGVQELTWTQNTYINNDGSESGYSVYSCSSFVMVSGTKLYLATRMYGSEYMVAFYDENKLFISGVSNPNIPDSYEYKDYVNIPENAVYARFNCITTHIDSLFTFKLYNVAYDTLAQVTKIKSNTDLSSRNITCELNFNFGKAWQGAVGATAAIANYPNRISNVVPYKLEKGIYKIVVPNGYRISYRTLDDANKVLADSGWITSDSTLIASGIYYYGFTGGKLNDASVTLTDYLQKVQILLNSVISTQIQESTIPCFANVKAVNHRGYNVIAPENTLPAFKLSRKNGFKYVETDVRFTSDSVPVLLHDYYINRTARNSDGTELENQIAIADITYAQAITYDFGIWKGQEYAGTKIPTLAQFMGLCRNIGLTPRVELNALTVPNAEIMYGVIESYGMSKKVEYNCNDITVAQKFLELEPSATIVYGMDTYDADTVDAVGALKTNQNTIIINMYYPNVSSALISKCKQYKIELEVWTVNSESVILNLDSFISGVTSDSLNASQIYYIKDMN